MSSGHWGTPLYTDAQFYVVSGTGNSYRVAAWMAEALRTQRVQVRVSPVRRGAEQEMASPDLIGLFLPTHGFTAPWQMIRFVLRLPRLRGTHAFVIATRAGMKIGRVHVPGFEGTACALLALLLALKGYQVRGMLGIDMPSNWTGLHPGLAPQSAASIIARARPRADLFMARLLAGQRVFGNPLIPLIGVALAPVSLAYLLLGRFMLAKMNFAGNSCSGCGVCADLCPVGAIRMQGRPPRPYWTFACESCMRCMNYCPRQAVEVGHSWGVLLYYLIMLPAPTMLLGWLSARLPWAARLQHGVVDHLLWYLWALLAMALAYYLFTWLIRIPLINALFTATTLTHYYRRYHEPETTADDLIK